MAARFPRQGVPIPELESVDKVRDKIKEHPLVLILFNAKNPVEHSIESRFRSWRTTYEDKYQLYVYKCVVSIVGSPLKKEYDVKKSPTFILFREGKEAARLEDAEKATPPSADGKEPNSDPVSPTSTAEERLKGWLDQVCSGSP